MIRPPPRSTRPDTLLPSPSLFRSLPNILTMSRIAAIPLLLALIYVDTPLYRWVALAGYVVACVTDYFDGYFARHMKQISPLGRFLDPIADTLLVASLIVMLVVNQQSGRA